MNKQLKMDLHIHTPASKCYLDEKTDETYMNILKEAVKKNVNIIAITDHNTIAGYKHFFEIKDSLDNEKNILSQYQNETETIKNRLKAIEEILDLYKKVWILPGVEITLNPGVHIIVITSNDRADDLSCLLDDIGYNDNMRGADSDGLPNIDIHNFLELPSLNDKIVFAPHIDSDKGIYKELGGLYRADVFKSDIICAVSCNSSTQLEKVQKLIKNDTNYRRNYVWAYLNASDAHRIEDVGKKTSFAKLETKTFEALKNALMNSTEFISDIENQDIEMFIKSLVKRQRAIMISNDNNLQNEFVKVICAALNSEYRCIILGVDKDARIVGTTISRDELDKLVDNSRKDIVNFQNNPVGVITEQLGNARYVHVVLLKNPATALCYIKSSDEVYVYSKETRKAKISDIEYIVQNRLLSGLEKFQEKNDNTISEIKDNLNTVQYPVEKYKLFKTLENGMRYLATLVKYKHVESMNNPNMWDTFRVGNANGAVFMAKNEEVVLDYAVLRFSCPRSCNEYSEEILNNMFIVNSSCLVITNKGGTYLLEIDETDKSKYYLDSEADYLCIKITDEQTLNNYTLIAWLKSKAFLWYITRLTGTTKLYLPRVYNSIIVPNLKCLNPKSEVEKISKKILEAEKSFLKEKDLIESNAQNDMENEEKYIDELNNLINIYNSTVNGMVNQIDEIIFNELRINERQKDIINNDLVAFGLAVQLLEDDNNPVPAN
ncbi:hypothetical protein SAMN04487831_11248 [Pseudobutyrivibrio sp. UC1225]|uniref:PHP domain-containing protein n=1 Tax=Pseudobutyrivibrio sp. UC1225 TaxID=1798185 RepID=UPI0008E3E5DD|nr:PHP domain-containing protein [Pseudobutyrivibrio sp. UC1225]SFO21572.1 hypothetical protein SAMN04487831_11248 [Pseudobutyrivibrio sp. UC1225]